MELVELVEPGIESGHAAATIELGGDGPLGERGHVEPRRPRGLVEVLRQADVSAGHYTQDTHSSGRIDGFAVTQWWPYRGRGKWSDYLRGERTYVWLSLIAKSLLGWQVFFNILV